MASKGEMYHVRGGGVGGCNVTNRTLKISYFDSTTQHQQTKRNGK